MNVTFKLGPEFMLRMIPSKSDTVEHRLYVLSSQPVAYCVLTFCHMSLLSQPDM